MTAQPLTLAELTELAHRRVAPRWGRRRWAWELLLLVGLVAAVILASDSAWPWLGLGAQLVITGNELVLRRADRLGPTPTERTEVWQHGVEHGLRLAHEAVEREPRPWLTLGAQQGWEMAQVQLAAKLAALRGQR